MVTVDKDKECYEVKLKEALNRASKFEELGVRNRAQRGEGPFHVAESLLRRCMKAEELAEKGCYWRARLTLEG